MRHTKFPFNNKYDLGDFVHSKVKEQTSTTLLGVVSKLVSNGKITKRSLSLGWASSCIIES